MTHPLAQVLDVQRRRLDEVEAVLDALDMGGTSVLPMVPNAVASFADLLADDEAWRAANDAHGLMPVVDLVGHRSAWSRDDLFVVGLAGALGFAAAWHDDRIDQWVRRRLDGFRHTDLMRRWEREAKLPAIDWGGLGLGGPNHRVRRPGHDLLRPVAALRQILTGQAEGLRWIEGVRIRDGLPRFDPVKAPGEAMVLWLKHLVTDAVTDRSLPLPGWTFLNELPWPQAQQFARFVYMGTRDGVPGLTIRRLAPWSLPVLVTETLVRAHLHGRALRERGSPALSESETRLRDEMLLAAHGLTGAACLGRTLTAAMVSGRGALAVRHVNPVVLVRLGMLGHAVLRRPSEQLLSWSELLVDLEKPWDLELATAIDEEYRRAP